MDRSKTIETFLRECAKIYETSDGTLRRGQLYYNHALQSYPYVDFSIITDTVSDPFYHDDNIEFFIQFLKEQIHG